MSFTAKLRHLFTPHVTNNFRARLLHNVGIFSFIGVILASNIFIRILDNQNLHILGFTSSVTIDEVVRATNAERAASGLKPLAYNEKLADAARRKAANMLSENYWSHNSPSGKSPWVWFKDAGYNYVFAGENLAKDFGDTNRMMNAWMASSSHKENIVNPKYSEIGIAVVPGSLQGSETVLVVQLFGAPATGTIAQASVAKKTPQIAQVKGADIKEVQPKVEAVNEPQASLAEPLKIAEISEEVAAPAKSPVPVSMAKINQFSFARILNLITTALFILVLIIDLILAESRSISRRVGNNWAHIVFINLILLATTIVNAGRIM